MASLLWFNVCSYCLKMNPSYHCGACKEVKYCSRNCQRIHWKIEHKTECQPKQTILNGLSYIQQLKYCPYFEMELQKDPHFICFTPKDHSLKNLFECKYKTIKTGMIEKCSLAEMKLRALSIIANIIVGGSAACEATMDRLNETKIEYHEEKVAMEYYGHYGFRHYIKIKPEFGSNGKYKMAIITVFGRINNVMIISILLISDKLLKNKKKRKEIIKQIEYDLIFNSENFQRNQSEVQQKSVCVKYTYQDFVDSKCQNMEQFIQHLGNQLVGTSLTSKLCLKCNRKNGVKLRRCSRCRKVFYCSKQCQKISWNNYHRYECNDS
eukprot:549367_1